jgi:beta-glucosidase
MIIFFFFGILFAQDYPFRNTSLTLDERVDNLMSLLTTVEKLAHMRSDIPAIERLGIPHYIWQNEALHGITEAGVATSFPQCIGLAATFDDEAVLKAFSIAGDEGRAKVIFIYFLFYILFYFF